MLSISAQDTRPISTPSSPSAAPNCGGSNAHAVFLVPSGSGCDGGASPTCAVSVQERSRPAALHVEPLSAARPAKTSRQRSSFLKQWLGKHRSDANDTPGVGPVNSYAACADELGAGLRGLTCKVKPPAGGASKRAASGSGSQCIADDGLDSPSKASKGGAFSQRKGVRSPTSARIRSLLPRALRRASEADVTRGVSTLSVRRGTARAASPASHDSGGELSVEASAGSGGYWSSRARKPRYSRKAKVRTGRAACSPQGPAIAARAARTLRKPLSKRRGAQFHGKPNGRAYKLPPADEHAALFDAMLPCVPLATGLASSTPAFFAGQEDEASAFEAGLRACLSVVHTLRCALAAHGQNMP